MSFLHSTRFPELNTNVAVVWVRTGPALPRAASIATRIDTHLVLFLSAWASTIAISSREGITPSMRTESPIASVRNNGRAPTALKNPSSII